jgi:putative FmdB family regulatory protein
VGLGRYDVESAMPIYEYQCRTCSQQFETLVLKGTVAECPACHGRDLEQLLSGFAVSSEGMRNASAKAARRAAATSSDLRDKNVAHAEYVKKHAEE